MSITLSALASQSDLISNARAIQNAALSSLNTSNPTLLASLITAASDLIRRHCARDFNLTSYTEIRNGGAYVGEPMLLRQFPVAAVTRVAADPATVLRVSNTSSSNQLATVATTTTGLSLSRTAAGTTTTSTLAFADYATITLLAAAVDALANGWDATVEGSYGDYPSAYLKSLQGASNAANSVSVPLEMYQSTLEAWGSDCLGSELGWRLDPDTGELYGRFPRGMQNIEVRYQAGFSTVPGPVQAACVDLVLSMYYAGTRDNALTSVHVGPDGYTLGGAGAAQGLPAHVLTQLAPYVAHDKRIHR